MAACVSAAARWLVFELRETLTILSALDTDVSAETIPPP
jgi:hypothetical protein